MCAPGRGASRVEHALLCDQHERPLRMPAACDLVLGCGDLLERAADVHRAGAAARLGRPGHRPVERVVELEHAGSVAVARERPPVAGRQRVAGDREDLSRREVEEHAPRAAKLVERAHLAVGLDLAAERPQQRRHRVGDRLRAPDGCRPADAVAEQEQHESERRGRAIVDRTHRVGGVAGKQRPCSLAREARVGQSGRRAEGRQAEARGGNRVAWRPERRAEQIADQLLPRVGERSHEPAVGPRIGAEAVRGLGDRPVQHDRASVVERVGERDLRMHELEPVLAQRQPAHEGRADHERVDRRADVVAEAGLRQLLGAGAPADRRRRLEHQHRAPRLCDRDRRGEPVRARADDDRVSRSSHALRRNGFFRRRTGAPVM